MPHIMLDDLELYYEEQGRPDGPPLVLLHGFTVTGASWAPQLPAFGRQYRLIVPDTRGHGRTNNPGGLAAMNHRQFARDTIGVCQALGIRQAIFCGESSGAHQLLSLAVEAPTLAQALVLTGGTYFYPDALRTWLAQQTPERFVRDIPAMQARHTALGADHWRQVVEAFFALGTHAHTDDFPEVEELRTITVPTLIVHGDRDRHFPAQILVDLYALLPDAELCILPQTGHAPPAEHPE